MDSGLADAPEPGVCRDFRITYFHSALQGECQMTLACPNVAGVFSSLRACASACADWSASVDPPAAGFEWPERTAPLAGGPRLSEGPAAAIGTDFMSELRQSYEHYDAAERASPDGVSTMSVRAPYGGPGGSAAAAADERCQLPILPGPCHSRVPSYGFNAASGKCEAFDYGGCGGNANKFSSYEKCASTCTPAVSFQPATSVKPVTPPLDRTMELAVAQCRGFKAPGSPRLGVEPGPEGPLVLQITSGTPSSKVLLFVGETAGEARTPANLECPGTKVGAKFNSAYAVEIGADGTGFFVLEGIGPEERDLCQKYVIEAVDTANCGTSFLDTRA